MTDALIELNDLSKRYGAITALAGLTLTVAQGEIFGLLGPNGAGKSTTLRLLAGLCQPSGGTVRVAGRDPWAEPEAVHRLMGVLPEGTGLYEKETALENLRLFAGLFGLPPATAAEALARTGSTSLVRRRVGKLSRGERQRVALARAVVHRPALLVLDEPTAGLDPAAAANFQDEIAALNAGGTTIVLCSHDMLEVERLCHRVALLDCGQLKACDSPARLQAEHGSLAGLFIHLTGRKFA